MAKKSVRCILCPIGCIITCRITGRNVTILGGQKCKKGAEYVQREALYPQRIITTLVLVEKGEWPLVSVKTTFPIPKEKIFSVMEFIKTLSITAPIKLGDTIARKIGGTQADLIATKNISCIKKARVVEDPQKKKFTPKQVL